jgi:hypothetical protein
MRHRTPSPLRRRLLGLALLALPIASPAIEEPDYEVTRQIDEAVELRRYAPYVVAEVVLQAPADDAGRRAFRSWPATSSARTRASGPSR